MATLQNFNGYERRHGWRYGLSIQLVIQTRMHVLPFVEKSLSPFCSINVREVIAQDFFSQTCQSVRWNLAEGGGIKYVIQSPSFLGHLLHLFSAKLNQTKSLKVARQSIDHFRWLDNEICPPV